MGDARTLQHADGVAQAQRAHHGVGAVRHQLKSRLSTGDAVGREARRNRESDARVATFEQCVEGILRVHLRHQTKVGARGEPFHQLAARRRVVEIADGELDPSHVGCRRVAEDEQLHDGRHEEDRQDLGIPPELQKLLEKHRQEPAHQRLLTMRTVATISSTRAKATRANASLAHTSGPAPLSTIERKAAM